MGLSPCLAASPEMLDPDPCRPESLASTRRLYDGLLCLTTFGQAGCTFWKAIEPSHFRHAGIGFPRSRRVEIAQVFMVDCIGTTLRQS